MKITKSFWDVWYSLYSKGRTPATEELVATLPVFKKGEGGLLWAEGVTPNYLNSYFEDLAEFLERKKKGDKQ